MQSLLKMKSINSVVIEILSFRQKTLLLYIISYYYKSCIESLNPSLSLYVIQIPLSLFEIVEYSLKKEIWEGGGEV